MDYIKTTALCFILVALSAVYFNYEAQKAIQYYVSQANLGFEQTLAMLCTQTHETTVQFSSTTPQFTLTCK